MAILITIFSVFVFFVFFMAVVFKAKELKARKSNGVETFCCGKCGTCEKKLPPAP